jgi:hypothetical protein
MTDVPQRRAPPWSSSDTSYSNSPLLSEPARASQVFRSNRAAVLAEPVTIAPLLIFRERCEARAIMVAVGMLTLQDAVDSLQRIALSRDLVDHYGQDRVQQIMATAFKSGGAR